LYPGQNFQFTTLDNPPYEPIVGKFQPESIKQRHKIKSR